MEIILFLILFPFLAALVMSCMKQHGLLRRTVQFTFCGVIVAAVILFAVMNLVGGKTVAYLPHTHVIDMGMLLVEWGLVVLVFYYSFKYRKYYCALLSILQTGAMTWLELSGRTDIEANHILADKLTVAMALIVGIVGCLICIYAIGYMKDYNRHHLDYKDRRSFFFAMLFLFLGAMMGLIFSSNLIWIYFFWEITSICSFLLIGYNQTDEAMDNSFRALWMNLLGGLGFAVAIIYSVTQLNIINIQDLVNFAVSGDERAGLALIPVVFLAFAGLTKSAQLPFSGWLLGAMVAPTPTSALLHSATMVKAGVYLLIRLAPALQGNTAGLLVTTIGGFTFLMTSMLAISQDDGKKVLAYSTISNLGLITACAGVGMHGIPGDVSSPSRFVRVAYTNAHYPQQNDEAANVSRLFHTLGSVQMVDGMAKMGDGQFERTLFTSGYSSKTNTYYMNTYDDPAIRSYAMADYDMDSSELISVAR